MGVSLENLKAFVAAADAGSFSEAARRMGKAQSRVSTSISNLEVDLGLSLFDRSGKFPVLSPEGETLLRDSRQVLSLCKALEDRARVFCSGIEPRFKLAADELIPPALLAKVLGQFQERFPETELEFFTGTLGDISAMVETGRADLGIEVPVFQPSEKCDWRNVGELNFVVVASPSHPLSALPVVRRRDLESHLQLVPVSRRGEREAESFLFGKRSWQIEDSRVIRELAVKGYGWGGIAEYLVMDDLKHGRLVKLPVIFGDHPLNSGIYLIWRKARVFGRAGEWIKEAFARALGGDVTQ
ncbi:MAG: LysR family transcriptional regulator [Desulfobacterales bacterium]|nr:LysR family transcriptional regulator [Desulfobacterales bacterium]